MARYGTRIQSPEIEEKFGPLDPEYASSYESHRGGRLDTLNYYGSGGEIDYAKTQKLQAYSKKYGSLLDNAIAQKWQRAGWGPYSTFLKGSDKTAISIAQDEVLREFDQREFGLRNSHQKAKRNPMLYE